jgi:hypothetical protein
MLQLVYVHLTMQEQMTKVFDDSDNTMTTISYQMLNLVCSYMIISNLTSMIQSI